MITARASVNSTRIIRSSIFLCSNFSREISREDFTAHRRDAATTCSIRATPAVSCLWAICVCRLVLRSCLAPPGGLCTPGCSSCSSQHCMWSLSCLRFSYVLHNHRHHHHVSILLSCRSTIIPSRRCYSSRRLVSSSISCMENLGVPRVSLRPSCAAAFLPDETPPPVFAPHPARRPQA